MADHIHTITETAQSLHSALQEYVEATYHISHPLLVEQRRRLLTRPGVISQIPYIESTPKYVNGTRFEDIGLGKEILNLLLALCSKDKNQPSLLHNPPYQHQSEALQKAAISGRSLVVMTGTGSGKTECFLLPILAKLAKEAHESPQAFRNYPAVRAILLYPMNALVNDQLARLRMLFGDPRVVSAFKAWSGRPARFARYTSRTLYPGVRSVAKDQDRLKPIREFFVHYLELAKHPDTPEGEAALRLVAELKARGKWPAKPDMGSWYGRDGTRWYDDRQRQFLRGVTLPDDVELLTRHEVLSAPPDIIVTNYSMLEYMLMRPIEGPIFERTAQWLRENPDETLLLVIDEAHLYRGAAGAEVALLLRRLRARLGIPPRQLQVICTSASFQIPEHAASFGAQLSGKSVEDFDVIKGTLAFYQVARAAQQAEVEAILSVDLREFHAGEDEEKRRQSVDAFLRYRKVNSNSDLPRALYDSLVTFPPFGLLVNATMTEAMHVKAITDIVFPGIDEEEAVRAITVMLALGSYARPNSNEPSLLPCRLHMFFRGLPGLWTCVDPQCTELPVDERGGPVGCLYSQPRDTCDCGSRVYELYTCRKCGTAYVRAYTDDLENPEYLWNSAGFAFRTHTEAVRELVSIDILLEEPAIKEDVEPVDLDLVCGRLNPMTLGPRTRRAFIRSNRLETNGQFVPCGVCGETAAFGKSTVQDHQTKGDQPFEALVSEQIQVQPPNAKLATRLAPHRGRKVLVFSDSRQTAARLAPNIQSYSLQDALRPLIVVGYRRLQNSAVAPLLSLEDLYLAVLIAAKEGGVRLRPELTAGESFHAEEVVSRATEDGALTDSARMLQLFTDIRSAPVPVSLLRAITKALTDRYYGLESLALASVIERSSRKQEICRLPRIGDLAETEEQKLALCRLWLRAWQSKGYWLSRMPASWWNNEIEGHSGQFKLVGSLLQEKSNKKLFDRDWLPNLLSWFAEPVVENKHRLKGNEVTLEIGGAWAYCQTCRTTQRPFPGRNVCVICNSGDVSVINPDTDSVFSARKGYYRRHTLLAMKSPPIWPMALIAAEHTAQLNTAQADEVFSIAEEHELLFQDVDLGQTGDRRERPAIDVLSCTTTMEVGIDIGSLSGVALRNMPPARANYQQRSGRAGRRGNAVATVIALGSADSHDEHYFTNPDVMIRGAVDDPRLTLDNDEIARRHITAYLVQRYHQAKLANSTVDASESNLFEVLGTVERFKMRQSVLNRVDFESWLRGNEDGLRTAVDEWLPYEISGDKRVSVLERLVADTLEAIDFAIDWAGGNETSSSTELATPDSLPEPEVQSETEENHTNLALTGNLLDRLLYKGVLPRYAFPTDVATFYVFDPNRSRHLRPTYRYTPSQGLAVALSQYAPGKEVWINNKLWTSGALYSPLRSDLYRAWQQKRLYYECEVCHFARTVPVEGGHRGDRQDCEACGSKGTFGEARFWLRPPGFAHIANRPEGTSPDDQPARSFATRAKLTAPTPADPLQWQTLNEHLRTHYTRQHLLVTNRGPSQDGYTYCTRCGLIEPAAMPTSGVLSAHAKPYPDEREPNCQGGAASKGMVLGTDFISDVLLISLRVTPPLTLQPGLLATDVVLRTLCEALNRAACSILELESNELQAEFRPALTSAGRSGVEAEIYLYDTLPGGAGFSRRVGELGLELFNRALSILVNCPQGCDRSCYRCLRGYKNKIEHDLLDRHLGARLLRYLLGGEDYTADPDRIDAATELLYQDLIRQGISDLRIDKNQLVTVPGIGDCVVPILVSRGTGQQFMIGLHDPLTPDVYPDSKLNELTEYSTSTPVLAVDELVVRRHLPWATSTVLQRLGH